MSKRPRRRRPKRSGPTHGRQERQRLSKTVRELYQPQDGDADAEWQTHLEAELQAQERRPRRASKTPTEPDEVVAEGPEITGRVVSITSGACRVEAGGRGLDCVLPSELAEDQRAAVAVGDEVAFETLADGTHRLLRVLERRTTLSRPDPHNPRRERVIAANVDVAVCVASVVEPPLRPGLIDRYLIVIERGGAQPAVCVNKIDLLPEGEERRRQLELLAPYRELGLPVLPCSAKTGEGLRAVRALLDGRTAVFVGHSGVGKSSLVNALAPRIGAETGEVSDGGTGRHTTSRSSLYRLSDGIRVIDTPGIRELGIWQLEGAELRAYFSDFDEHAAGCRFADCSHSHEPECGVQRAVETGAVPRARYATYLRILESLESLEP